MKTLDRYLDQRLANGLAWLTKQDAVHELGQTPEAFLAAAERLANKHRLASPKRGFYLILRPEDRATGAPDPARWITPLMDYMRLDYRISLLRAAAFHGSSHQAAMVFQVIVPRQLRPIRLGRHRVDFLYQQPSAFAKVNQPQWLGSLKTDAGYAKVAGAELTLFDCIRYYHKAAGLNGVAQAVHDIGGKASPRTLPQVAALYENAAVRRLGYLLEHFGHARQAASLESFAAKAKSFKKLDPSIRRIAALADQPDEPNDKWKLLINAVPEIDA
jgi:predicted transcriptional regulator of viral defense system